MANEPQEGPLARYRALVAEGALKADPAQRAAIEKLQLLHRRLIDYRPARSRSLFGLFVFSARGEAEEGVRRGLYLYGGVGRGKSMLMDLFFETAPVARKQRAHFHAFMQEVHAGIDAARAQGSTDPIQPVAEKIAADATLLCFDEMQVTDIADAMILGRLFDKLFDAGVAVVVTSNRHPTDLYKNGLNRQLFVPFIERISAELDVHHLDGPTDFRLARLRGLEIYHTPLGAAADAAMNAAWDEVTDGAVGAPLSFEVSGRTVVIPTYAAGVGRAEFEDLCGAPLGAADYLGITERVRTLFIDRIPKLSRANHDRAKRFVTLIDTLYEAKIHLICSADAEPDDLYQDGEGAFEFERTASRLMEMRSADWAARET
ncbi:MAG: cell division protein ZapE [Neomegalonema sp.]|nr:cell division protein ZapE [Neomegalonema sp.]